MSLINEALKKAQGQRPGQGGPVPPESPVPPGEPAPHHPPEKRHRRSFIWGFIMAVFVVGIFTTLLATFFVWQILGDDKPEESSSPAATVMEPTEEPIPRESSETPGVDELAAEASPEDAAPADGGQAPSGPSDAPDTSHTPPADAVTAAPPATSAPPPPQPPNPAAISRMLELEIRGTMSGGTKVLILDQATGRTKSYKVGESLGGSMGFVIEEITESSIKFRDYAGYIHTKSF